MAIRIQRPAASGDTVGPANSSDNAVARFDGTTGRLLKDSPNLTFDGVKLSMPVDAVSTHIELGASADLTLDHDGTDSHIINDTGELIIQNTDVNADVLVKLGTSTSVTTFTVLDSSDNILQSTRGDGKMLVTGPVEVGTAIPTASALLSMHSTTQGFLPPKMTTTQRDLISSPASGLEIYNTTTNEPEYYNGTVWGSIISAGEGVVDSVTGGTNINVTGTAADPVVNLDDVIIGSGAAGLLDLQGAVGATPTDNGGVVSIAGGVGGATSGNGGAISIKGTDGNTNNSSGGSVTIATGDGGSASGDGGNLILTTGSTNSGDGGDFTATLGTAVAANRTGGQFNFNPGAGTGVSPGGPLIVNGAAGGATGGGSGVVLNSGAGGATSGPGGGLTLTSGSATAGVSDGGNVTVTTGDGVGLGGLGGDLDFITGASGGTSGSGGGNVSFTLGTNPGDPGADFIVNAGFGGNGGAVNLTAGTGGIAGIMTLKGGTGGGTNVGGIAKLQGGTGGVTNATGGAVQLRGGTPGSATAIGGGIDIAASDGGATSGDGGDITLQSGSGQGINDDSGLIAIETGTAGASGTIGPVLLQRFNGSVGIGVALAPVASAKLEMASATQGFLPPRMTTTNRNAISSPATGLEIFNTTTSQPEFFDGAAWSVVGLVDTVTGGTNINVTGTASDPTVNLDDVIIGSGAAGLLDLKGAPAVGATDPGGAVDITAGVGGATSGTGGGISLTGGGGSPGGGEGGAVTIAGGLAPNNAGNFDGGALSLFSGGGADGGAGGELTVTSGNAGNNPGGGGGNISILSGVGGGNGSSGSLNLTTGLGATSSNANSGAIALTTGDGGGDGSDAGPITLTGGFGGTVNGAGGRFAFIGGLGSGNRVGGRFDATGGQGGITGAGGAINLTAGDGGATSGNGGDATLESGGGAAGGALAVTSGDGAFAGGTLSINSGSATTSGIAGTISLQSGQSAGASAGGQLHVFGGIGGASSGTGGQILVHAGGGGNIDGDGGLLSLEGGQGFSSGNSDGGDVDIQGGQNFGTGVHGDVLIANGGGAVGIGSTPIASALLNVASVTQGFMKPRLTETQRDAISSPANGLALHNTTTRRPEFFDDLGTGSDWQRVSAVPQTVFEIYTSADFDALATAGVITVTSGDLTISMGANISTTNTFDMSGGGRLTIRRHQGAFGLTYTGAGTFITSVDSVVVVQASLIATGGGTLFNITGGIGNIINVESVVIQGWKIGSIGRSSTSSAGPSVFFLHMVFIDWKESLTLTDAGVLTIDEIELIPFAGATTPFVVIEGPHPGSYILNLIAGGLRGSEHLLRVDPGLSDSAKVVVTNSPITGTLFDTSGGITGTFQDVFDATVALTTINSVTNSSGVARFNFTVGPTLFVNQEVDIVNFVTQTTYNQTGIITATGAGFFEVSSIAFVADDATGDFSSDSVQLFETATALVDGDTLTIDTDNDTEYDGGATVYDKQTNTFKINRVFTFTVSGTWDTSGVDQKDTRVLASLNSGSADSKNIAGAFVNNNSTAHPTITNNTFSDMAFGTGGSALTVASNIESWKLVDSVIGIFEYTGNSPFDGVIGYDFTSVSSGGAVEFRFKWLKDTGSGFAVLPDDVEALVDVGSTASSVGKAQPLTANKGDQIKPQVTRNTGASTLITSYASINVLG